MINKQTLIELYEETYRAVKIQDFKGLETLIANIYNRGFQAWIDRCDDTMIQDQDLEHHIRTCWDINPELEQVLRIIVSKLKL